MPTPRADIASLRLHSTPSNLKKAERLRAQRPDPQMNDPEILQQLLADAQREYEIAMQDVAERGTVIEATRYTSKGKAYTREDINPYFRVASKLATQIRDLKVSLAKFAPKANKNPNSFEAMFPDVAGDVQ
jgi:hypothetical protein